MPVGLLDLHFGCRSVVIRRLFVIAKLRFGCTVCLFFLFWVMKEADPWFHEFYPLTRRAVVVFSPSHERGKAFLVI